jgi:hypothetical protein
MRSELRLPARPDSISRKNARAISSISTRSGSIPYRERNARVPLEAMTSAPVKNTGGARRRYSCFQFIVAERAAWEPAFPDL